MPNTSLKSAEPLREFDVDKFRVVYFYFRQSLRAGIGEPGVWPYRSIINREEFESYEAFRRGIFMEVRRLLATDAWDASLALEVTELKECDDLDEVLRVIHKETAA